MEGMHLICFLAVSVAMVTSQATPSPTPTSTVIPVSATSEGTVSSTTKGFNIEKHYNVTLRGGRSSNEGLVVLTGENTPEWYIYNPSMSYKDASVICRQLGYGDGGISRSSPYFGSKTTPHSLYALNCQGTEEHISNCSHNKVEAPVSTTDGFPIAGVTCNVKKAEKYPFGYPAIKRSSKDEWTNAIYIMHPTDRLPHQGYITEWNFYPTKPGMVYMQVWRRTSPPYAGSRFHSPPIFSRSHYYFLVGQTQVNVTDSDTDKKMTVSLERKDQIPFMSGDVLGMYFPQRSLVPYSKKRYCSSYSRTLYMQRPYQVEPTKKYYFREKSYGWNPCRIYSVYAIIHNTTVTEHVTLPMPTTTPFPTMPPDLDVRLVSGRKESEGLVQVAIKKKGDKQEWGYVCDDGWDNKEATVVCKQLGYAGGVAKYQPFFGHGDAAQSILLDDLVCNGTESSLALCRAPRGWGKHNCRHREDAGVECIPHDYATDHQANRTTVFGYPAVERNYQDSNKGSVYILDPSDGIPYSGAIITGWSVYLKAEPGTAVTNNQIYLQVWRYHGNKEASLSQVYMDYMLVGQQYYNMTVSTNTSGLLSITMETPIQARAGDLLGFHFPGVNTIPFDNRMRCRPSNRGLYIDSQEEPMVVGNTYKFQRRLSLYSPCKIFSVYAKLYISDYKVLSSFTYGNHDYQIIADSKVTEKEARDICQRNLGSQDWDLLRIDSQAEMDIVNEAMNTLEFNTTVNYWLDVDLNAVNDPTRPAPYTKWGYCEPSNGKECVALSNYHQGSGSISGLDFHMYMRDCFDTAYFICETTQVLSPTPFPPQGKSTSRWTTNGASPGGQTDKGHETPQQKVADPGKGGMIAGVIIGLIIVAVIILVVGFILYRRRQNLKNDESRVRFMHLDQNEKI